MMTREIQRRFFKTNGWIAFAIFALFPVVVAGSDAKPNVLFIAVDDLRPELGCYGVDHIKSPNIDKLAARGTVFERAYCQVAVCGASRASLLTGLRPTPKRFLSYKTYAEKDAPDAMTLPEEFRKNGYHCISNGKIFHHRNDTAARSWSEAPWNPSIGGATTLHPESKQMRGGAKNRGPVFEAPDVPDSAYPDGQIADRTIADLKRLKENGKPFFLACGFLKPHLPFYAPKKYWDLYDRNAISVADNQYSPRNSPKPLKGSGEINNYHNRNIKYNSEQWHRSCRHGYYACVSYVDAQIGRVLNSLDDLGLREKTIVVLWGDHGWHLGEHNFWGKHNVMHLSTNSPMIVSAPGFKNGQSCKRLVEFVDIYPTLCDLAGISSVNETLAGKSFKPLLTDPDKRWKEAVFSKFGNARSVITERYNYAEFKNGERMLFDLKLDASENNNIAETAEHQELVTELSLLLKSGIARRQSKNQYPQFSWDRIPLYMHIRKAKSYTDDEIEFLAKFPLITFEKSNGHRDHGSVEAGTLMAARAVKEINPNTTILFYRNVLVHYGNYAAGKGLARIPGAMLQAANGDTKLVRNRVMAYDLSNADLRTWWVNSCRSMTANPNIDGIFLDGNVKALEPGYLKMQIGAAKKKRTMEGYHLLMKQTREAIGPNKLMVANLLRARFENAGLEYLDYFDGSYLEGFFHNVGGASYEEYVAKGIDAMQKAARQGKIIAFTTGFVSPNRSSGNPSESGIDEVHQTVKSDAQARADLIYPLAIFLVCAEKHSYFRIHEGYSADENSRWMRWFPEYDRPLGPPTGPAKKDGYRYFRTFQHASVSLDIKNRTAEIHWRNPEND